MSSKKIENGRYWDLPWSLVSGCTPCSPGCDHCWSAGMAHRFGDGLTLRGEGPRNGKFNGQIVTHPERLSIPLKRKKPTVYSLWNDLFHEDVPVNFLEYALAIMTNCPQHTFLVLTKRAQRLNLMTQDRLRVSRTDTWPIENLRLGITICNQQEADEKIPVFLQVPGKKFLSIEPMLGDVDLLYSTFNGADSFSAMAGIDCVILGGETIGNKPGREMKIEWAENVVDQCTAAGVPIFIKQLHINRKVSKDMSEWPEKLRRRELPWVQP